MKWKSLANAIKKTKEWILQLAQEFNSLSSSKFLKKAGICKKCLNHEGHSHKASLTLIALSFLMLAGSSTAKAQIPEKIVSQIANAIYVAEGRVPTYGIKSVACHSESSCRLICENTIRNNFKRWEKTGGSVPFLEFLASRYAPIGVSNDPNNLNKNWLPNVRRIINSQILIDGLKAEQTRRFFDEQLLEVMP